MLQIKANVLNLTAAIGSITASYVAYKVFKIYLIRRKYRHIPGPPTKGILGFFFGHMIETKSYTDRDQIFPDLFIECRKKYGTVFKIQFLEEIFIITTNKDAIKEVLITKNYPKSNTFLKFIAYPLDQRFLGIGLVTDINHQRWKHRRAFFNAGFYKNVLMTFVNQFNVKTDLLMERLRTLADGKTVVDLFTEFNHVTLDAIALIAFGMNVDSINHKDDELSKTISFLLKVLDDIFRDPLFKLRHRKAYNEFKNSVKVLREIGRNRINERIENLKNEEYVPTDILANILKNYNDNEIDLEAMVDDFVTFFLAGQETTANALGFCFLELGSNPEIFKKAREEVDRIVGEKTELSYQDAVDLKYCSAIFKETLRLYPPAVAIDRKCTEEFEIDGYKIPKGTIIGLSPYLSGRDESNFDNPLEFRPERFLRDSDSSHNSFENYAYFPFSLGPRNCIGQNFAQIEGVMCIAKLVQNFDYILEFDAKKIVLSQALTLKPKHGTKCRITLRQ